MSMTGQSSNGLASWGSSRSPSKKNVSHTSAPAHAARTAGSLAFSTRDGRKRSVKKYPVAQAVNDAFRYNNVCTLADGINESSQVLEKAPSAARPKEEGEEV